VGATIPTGQAAVLAAFVAALDDEAAIGFGGAKQVAADASRSEDSRRGIGVYRAQPIYEVGVFSGPDEDSVKANAMTGAIPAWGRPHFFGTSAATARTRRPQAFVRAELP
jgi:hypothetical protein